MAQFTNPADLQAQLLSMVEDVASRATAGVSGPVMASWAVKAAAAEAVLAGGGTPLQQLILAREAALTGETVPDLAARVNQRALANATLVSTLEGLRRKFEPIIAAAQPDQLDPIFGQMVEAFETLKTKSDAQERAMSKSDTFENSLLRLIFNATPIANIADNAAASPLTSLFVSLHTADPGEAGTQATNETAYTGYARQGVARTTGGWTVTGNSVSPVANIDFPACTASPGAALTHFAIGVASSGATTVLYKGAFSASQAMSIGIIPRITTALAITED